MGNTHALIVDYRGGQNVIRVIVLSSKLQKNICNNIYKNYPCRFLVFKWILLIIRVVLPTVFRYGNYEDILVLQEFYKLFHPRDS